MTYRIFLWIYIGLLAVGCTQRSATGETGANTEEDTTNTITPAVVTEKVAYDSDDPAIWINHANPEASMILGTDKGGDAGDGAIYVFDLEGKIDKEKTVQGINRPNNIDVEYGMVIDDDTTDIAVFTERYDKAIRVFKLPEMVPVDNGGIRVFEGEAGEEFTSPMGLALYKDSVSGKIYAVVSRKSGPSDGSYLWQYELIAKKGFVDGQLVRKFGVFSGEKEIEAIAIDDEMGYVYYSDESFGIRKYYANPDSSNVELAVFGKQGFTDDREGISIYKTGPAEGYILVSDQQANLFHVYPRSGTRENPHDHPIVTKLPMSTKESDGSEAVNFPIRGKFEHGIFVAMSDNATFQIYDWNDLAAHLSDTKATFATKKSAEHH